MIVALKLVTSFGKLRMPLHTKKNLTFISGVVLISSIPRFLNVASLLILLPAMRNQMAEALWFQIQKWNWENSSF
jgi:hypothetical protein